MNKILNSARKLMSGLVLVLASSVLMTAHAKNSDSRTHKRHNRGIGRTTACCRSWSR